jgi:hypothetical protein
VIRDHARLHLPSFLVQVLATSVGLLLALGLDQWRDHRKQVALAHAHLAAIQAELKANQAEIASELESCRTFDATLSHFSRVLREGGALKLDANFSFSLASLRQSAWDMAVAGQTPLRSEPGRMTRLANAYESIRVLRSIQDRLLEQMDLLGELGAWLESGTLPPLEVRHNLANRVDTLRARISVLRNTAPSVQRDIALSLAP